MKKLLLVLLVAGFVGFAFAFTPTNVPMSEVNESYLMDDTTKTVKKNNKTKKDCTKKKACCKSKCSGEKTKKKSN